MEQRRTRSSIGLISLAAVLLAVACAPSPSRSGEQEGRTAGTGAPSRTNRVTIANGIDPRALATKFDAAGVFSRDHLYIPNSPLVVLDAVQGASRPLLAAELPSQERGTWTVNPDGAMATTWKIRPNAVWHDGQPVRAADFAFAFGVYMDDALEISNREPERLVSRVEPVDEKTFVIHWKQVYPWANRLGLGELEALPAHLLRTPYEEGDKVAFTNLPFWSGPAYVGTGPYRLVEWEKGVHMIYRAFDQYFMGRPKIDEVIVRIIADINTVVANVLSGAIDVTVSVILNQQARLAVKEQWDRTADGQVGSNPTYFRIIQFQQEPGRALPALLDPRMRRAIAHAIDRPAIAEAVSAGTSPATEVMITPNDPLYPRVDQAIAKYAYDSRRALALLEEAGWTRRGEGLTNARGEALTLDITTPQVAENESEMSLAAADLSKLGMEITQTPIPQARSRDREYRASFRGLAITATSIDVPQALKDYTSEECPNPARGWAGSNRGCWRNPEFDRLFAIVNSTLNEGERTDAIVQMFKTHTEDVGLLGMSYHMDNIAVRKGLVGPGPRWPAQAGHTWNVFEWRWE